MAVCTVVVVATQSTPALATSSDAHIIVKTSSEEVRAMSGTGGSVITRIDDSTALVKMPNMSEAQAIGYLSSLPGVEYAEPDHEFHATAVPTDPCFAAPCETSAKQWSLEKVGLPAAWDINTGRESISIAIVDSGVDAGHPDLEGQVRVGDNFSTDLDNDDDFGHGTHVAGIAGASTNNNQGIAGVDWAADLLSVKVLNGNGVGTATAISKGVRYATDQGVRIINLSLGASTFSQALADAVVYAQERGVLVIAAADNQASTTLTYPGALPGVVAVGASTPSDALASFSNYGTWVDLLAPGTGIISTWPRAKSNGVPYEVEDGTSMATPLVSGIAALVWSENPYLSAQGVARRLSATADPVQGGGIVAGGRVSAERALSGLPNGYRFAASDGGVFSFGVPFHGSMGGQKLNKPIVTSMTTGDDGGYWLVASDGGVFSFGNAVFYGSTGGEKLNKPIVSSAASRSGLGYWLVGSDGGVFSYGDAQFFGSTGGMPLNKPIVDIVPTATGQGYWLVASDGGVFAFGDATFYGSTGGMSLNKPIVGAERSPDGAGYWLVASDGGIFAFGDAAFEGSAGSLPLQSPIVSMSASATGDGYWLIAGDGGVFSYGDAPFRGSVGGQKLNAPIVTGMS
jgi:subtilisin family serine protease